MKTGRPSEYTKEKADKLCAKLSSGESLRTACKDEDMPSAVTVFAWLRTYPEFLKQYEKAKEESADAMTEEMLDIADNGSNDWILANGTEEQREIYRQNGEAIQRSRLRVDTRKWIASKLKPKKYGEKMDMTTDGEKIQSVIIYKPEKK